MPIFQLKKLPVFPPVDLADGIGLLAFGGDLSPERLICAYESGIFPWYEEGQPILWWSPPLRMVLIPQNFKLSKSLRLTLNKVRFELSIDKDFEEVISKCAHVDRPGQIGTWITDDMAEAYIRLHRRGFAHSFETWHGGQLVGGLYGISLGRAFFGESMFSLESDASKVSFHHLSQFAVRHGFLFIDCQLATAHLASLGAKQITRDKYMVLLKEALDFPDLKGSWDRL